MFRRLIVLWAGGRGYGGVKILTLNIDAKFEWLNLGGLRPLRFDHVDHFAESFFFSQRVSGKRKQTLPRNTRQGSALGWLGLRNSKSVRPLDRGSQKSLSPSLVM